MLKLHMARAVSMARIWSLHFPKLVLCHSWTTSDGEVDLNRHIDECLNRQLLPSSASSFPSASSSSAATTSARQVKIDAFLVRRR